MEKSIDESKISKPFQDKKKFPFVVTTGIILGYIAISSSLWHIGYWSTFNFNYFEYSSLTDLFKATIFPLLKNLWLFIFLLLFCFFTIFIFTNPNIPDSNNSIQIFKKTKSPLKIPSYFPTFFSLVIFLILLIVNNTYISMMMFCPLLVITISYILVQRDIFHKFFLGNRSWVSLILLLIAYPIFNFWIAKHTSLKILYKYQYESISQIILNDSSLQKKFTNQPFLGSTEKYSFILSPEKNIYLLNNAEVKFICLKKVSIDSNKLNFKRAGGVFY